MFGSPQKLVAGSSVEDLGVTLPLESFGPMHIGKTIGSGS
mgnify:CR=1 FL=1